MQKRMRYVLFFLIISVFGSGVLLSADSNFCPLPSTGGKATVDLPQEKVLAPEKSYSVERNQVLLEISTATW